MEYNCEKCKYRTVVKQNYRKNLLSKKHKIIKKSTERIYLKGDDKFDHNFFKPKVVILQLTNVTREFFIYENKIYKLDFETYDGFLKSKKELIDNINVVDKNDFVSKLESELELLHQLFGKPDELSGKLNSHPSLIPLNPPLPLGNPNVQPKNPFHNTLKNNSVNGLF